MTFYRVFWLSKVSNILKELNQYDLEGISKRGSIREHKTRSGAENTIHTGEQAGLSYFSGVTYSMCAQIYRYTPIGTNIWTMSPILRFSIMNTLIDQLFILLRFSTFFFIWKHIQVMIYPVENFILSIFLSNNGTI